MTASSTADAKFARDAWLRALARTARLDGGSADCLPVALQRLAESQTDAAAVCGEDSALTYGGLTARANRYAHFGLSQGLRAGDVVALMMSNEVDYVAVWLGLTRIGATVALVNTNLTGDALRHSLRIVSPTLIIVDAQHAAAVAAVLGGGALTIPCWISGAGPVTTGFIDRCGALETVLQNCDDASLSEVECPLPHLDSAALYIYTSGTTGLPKAARISHSRIVQWSQWFAGLMNTSPTDRMYNCLPLYHSVGGVVAMGATLIGGGTVVVRKRFSASNFWRDVHAERCTLFQYIGELCRYLVNAPPQAGDTTHSLRLACGNGLRPEVWSTFQSRFHIPRILEYYASTEGNFSLYNCEGEPGSIGRIPPFLAQRLPVALLRVDEDGEPRRGTNGFCERCAVDEPGEAVGQIPELESGRIGRFEGYADPAATAKKVLRGVFAPGDAWYRSGDLMRRDARGFYYFVDRLGDTFRWKGENVSTAEVLSALCAAAGVQDGVVYGVRVPGNEGRACMAALIVATDFDLSEFHTDIATRLPAYARPLFLRLLPELAATGTFKPIKRELIEVGFDIERVTDRIYIERRSAGTYVPLEPAEYAAIQRGEARF